MEIIHPPQLPQINTIDLHYHKKSAYWGFMIIFLGIISFSVLGLYAISVYERKQEAQMNMILGNTQATRFVPVANEANF